MEQDRDVTPVESPHRRISIVLFCPDAGPICAAPGCISVRKLGNFFFFFFCCAESVAAHRLSLISVYRLLITVASSCCGMWALGLAGSVAVHSLSCPEASGIFLEQGSNPCPLYWQADS